MTVTLQRLAAGDTNYIVKHNSNQEILEAAIADLELLAANAAASSDLNVIGAFTALFGTTASLIGYNSYKCTGSGVNLTVQAGFCWRPSLTAVVRKSTSTILDFTGISAGTWYITADATGNPVRTSTLAEAAYSVVWTGSAFGTITRLLPIVFGAVDDAAAQISTALGTTYNSLDERLEAGETKAVAGDLARTYLLGRLSKSVAGSADVALTTDEANNMGLVFTGTVTADISITISLSSKVRAWLARNDTSGGKKITLKGSAGTGVVLPAGAAVWVYHDGTNIIGLPKATTKTLTYSSTVTADFSQADTIKMTLAGNSTITLAGAVDKQKCVLELTQDGVGSRTVTFVGTRFGSDLASITLSTTPGLTDKIGFIYDSAAAKYDVVALLRGF